VSGPRVLQLDDGTWRMWYYGRDENFDPEINLPTGRCGLARSDDGLAWERVQGPLTRGAVFEPHPDAHRFDSSHVGVSDVAYRDDVYWMWYFGGDHTRTKFGEFEVKGMLLRPGCAVSRDGLHWLRLEGPYRGAVLDLGPPGQFDMAMVGWPQVMRCHDGMWRLWYHSLDPTRMAFVIGMAESADGLVWSRRGEALGPGEAGAFDEQGAATRHVIRHDGRYWMFYEGVGKNGYRSLGLAVSDDAVRWARHSGHETDGSVFARAPSGSGRWDAFAVGTPCVVPIEDGSFRLYYIGSNETEGGFADELGLKHQIGLAVSDGPDLTRWERW
jgi:beta-xylosidase